MPSGRNPETYRKAPGDSQDPRRFPVKREPVSRDGQFQQRRRPITCHYCRQEGHVFASCSKFKLDQRAEISEVLKAEGLPQMKEDMKEVRQALQTVVGALSAQNTNGQRSAPAKANVSQVSVVDETALIGEPFPDTTEVPSPSFGYACLMVQSSGKKKKKKKPTSSKKKSQVPVPEEEELITQQPDPTGQLPSGSYETEHSGAPGRPRKGSASGIPVATKKALAEAKQLTRTASEPTQFNGVYTSSGRLSRQTPFYVAGDPPAAMEKRQRGNKSKSTEALPPAEPQGSDAEQVPVATEQAASGEGDPLPFPSGLPVVNMVSMSPFGDNSTANNSTPPAESGQQETVSGEVGGGSGSEESDQLEQGRESGQGPQDPGTAPISALEPDEVLCLPELNTPEGGWIAEPDEVDLCPFSPQTIQEVNKDVDLWMGLGPLYTMDGVIALICRRLFADRPTLRDKLPWIPPQLDGLWDVCVEWRPEPPGRPFHVSLYVGDRYLIFGIGEDKSMAHDDICNSLVRIFRSEHPEIPLGWYLSEALYRYRPRLSDLVVHELVNRIPRPIKSSTLVTEQSRRYAAQLWEYFTKKFSSVEYPVILRALRKDASEHRPGIKCLLDRLPLADQARRLENGSLIAQATVPTQDFRLIEAPEALFADLMQRTHPYLLGFMPQQTDLSERAPPPKVALCKTPATTKKVEFNLPNGNTVTLRRGGSSCNQDSEVRTSRRRPPLDRYSSVNRSLDYDEDYDSDYVSEQIRRDAEEIPSSPYSPRGSRTSPSLWSQLGGTDRERKDLYSLQAPQSTELPFEDEDVAPLFRPEERELQERRHAIVTPVEKLSVEEVPILDFLEDMRISVVHETDARRKKLAKATYTVAVCDLPGKDLFKGRHAIPIVANMFRPGELVRVSRIGDNEFAPAQGLVVSVPCGRNHRATVIEFPRKKSEFYAIEGVQDPKISPEDYRPGTGIDYDVFGVGDKANRAHPFSAGMKNILFKDKGSPVLQVTRIFNEREVSRFMYVMDWYKKYPNTIPSVLRQACGTLPTPQTWLDAGVFPSALTRWKDHDLEATSVFQEAYRQSRPGHWTEDLRRMLTRPVVLVEGPPGTGKTTFATDFVALLAELEPTIQNKIVVVTPSNASADAFTNKLLRYFPGDNPRVAAVTRYAMRPYATDHLDRSDPVSEVATFWQAVRRQDTEFVADRYCHWDLNDEELAQFYLDLEQGEQDALNNAKIIVCTASMAMSSKLSGLQNVTLVVDEAAQLSNDRMVPLLWQFDPRQLALVGDTQQLRPVSLSKEAATFGYRDTLMHMLRSRGHVAVRLTRCFRCPRDQLMFSNIYYYDGTLEAENPSGTTLMTGKSVMAVDLRSGYEEISPRADRSFQNRIEAVSVLQYLGYMHHCLGIPYADMVVLTPYAGQAQLIQNKCAVDRQAALSDVLVRTIDQFQGLESKHVILTLVRGQIADSDEGLEEKVEIFQDEVDEVPTRVGFLSDPARLNVALTRGSKSLTIFANLSWLSRAEQAPHLSALRQHLKNRNMLLTASEYENQYRIDCKFHQYTPPEFTVNAAQRKDGRTRFVYTVRLNDRPFQGLLDTGADLCLISESAVQALGLKYNKAKTTMVTSWTGEVKATKGTVEISVEIGQRGPVEHEFHVTHDQYCSDTTACIIGYPLLNRWGLREVFDRFLNDAIPLVPRDEIAGKGEEFRSPTPGPLKVNRVALAGPDPLAHTNGSVRPDEIEEPLRSVRNRWRRTKVPALSAVITYADFRGLEYDDNRTYLVQVNETDRDRLRGWGLEVPDSLVRPKKGLFPVRVNNIGTEDRHLPADFVLGQISLFEGSVYEPDETGKIREVRIPGLPRVDKAVLDADLGGLAPGEVIQNAHEAFAKADLDDPENQSDYEDTPFSADAPEVKDLLAPRSTDDELIANINGVLDERFAAAGNRLTKKQQDDIRRLCLEHFKLFAAKPSDLGRTSRVVHDIDTGDEAPIKQNPFRCPEPHKKVVEEHIEDMLRAGVIEPSESPWASRVVLVKKKDGKLRFCVDYRKLNNVTKKDVYPLPRIDDILDQFRGAKYFTSLDCMSGFWNVPLTDEAKEKTAFATHLGLFQFVAMPFGLCNAPATFQRAMTQCVAGLGVPGPYLDDIPIATKTWEEHTELLSKVFKRLLEWDFRLKLEKCDFACDHVTYLGHVITAQGIKTNPKLVDKVRDFPAPKDISGLRSFLGLTGYYRRFIPSYATVAAPLTALLKKGVQFSWTESREAAFKELKRYLTDDPILKYPDFDKEFILQTDASDYGVGAVLSQIQDDGHDHPIAYASATLNKHERNYSVTEKECLAVVFAVKVFRPYLLGPKPFTVVTDHAPLTALAKHRDTAGRLGRWNLILSEFKFHVRHKPGRAHANADALSRMVEQTPVIKSDMTGKLPDPPGVGKGGAVVNALSVEQPTDTRPPQVFDLSEVDQIDALPELLVKDQLYGPIVEYLRDGKLPGNENDRRLILSEAGRCQLRADGILLRARDSKHSKPTDPKVLICLPKSLQRVCMRVAHALPVSGHLSAETTYARLKNLVYWPKMKEEVFSYVRGCLTCQESKVPPAPGKYLMTPIVASMPLERVVMDVLGPLRVTEDGNKYIIIFTDHFTKWTAAVAMPDQLARTVAEALVEKVILCVGPMHTLASDQGTNFLSQIVSEICDLFGTRQMQSVAYRPQTQGLVERFNRTLLSMLRCFVDDECDDWDKYLPYLIYAYNTSPNRVTGDTPFRLMYGRDPKPFIRLPEVDPEKPVKSYTEYRERLEARMLAAYELAQKASLQEYERMKHRLRSNARYVELREGDLVWLKRMAFPSNLHRKLSRKYTGPWRIQKLDGPNVRISALGIEGQVRTVHRDHVKPMFLYRSSDQQMEGCEVEEPVGDLTDCQPGVEPTIEVEGQELTESSDDVHAQDRFSAEQQYYDPMAFVKQRPPIRIGIGDNEYFAENMDEARDFAADLQPRRSDQKSPQDLLRDLVEAPDMDSIRPQEGSLAEEVDRSDVSEPESLGITTPGAEHLPGGSGVRERRGESGNVELSEAVMESLQNLESVMRSIRERDNARVDPIDDVDPVWERLRKGRERDQETTERCPKLRRRVKAPSRFGHD